jgi:predicted permease
VNVYIAAAEVDRGADLASRMVFWTTIGSAVVIPLVLLFVRSSVP